VFVTLYLLCSVVRHIDAAPAETDTFAPGNSVSSLEIGGSGYNSEK
jgi:hypothetical protein